MPGPVLWGASPGLPPKLHPSLPSEWPEAQATAENDKETPVPPGVCLRPQRPHTGALRLTHLLGSLAWQAESTLVRASGLPVT